VAQDVVETAARPELEEPPVGGEAILRRLVLLLRIHQMPARLRLAVDAAAEEVVELVEAVDAAAQLLQMRCVQHLNEH
jgi:hypothetical protein